ncbi:hypothetical protein ACLB2K_037636 [Fragaria x ananassa]
MDWQCEIARVELERKNSLRGSVRESEEVSENGEDGNNNLSEQVATLFFDGACDSKASMAGLGAIIMSGSVNVIHAIGQSDLDLSDIGGVMDAVRSLKSEFEWISWKHVRKHKNQITHTLAIRALKMDQALLCFDLILSHPSSKSLLPSVIEFSCGSLF